MIKTGNIFIFKIIVCLFWGNVARPQSATDSLLAGSAKTEVKITRSWELPKILQEVSGISYVDADKIACIQDEIGTIFIYNTASRSIELEIPFAPPGDYEGIALVNDDAYVAVADGRIIEVTNYRSSKLAVKEYGTHLTVKQNVEGICYDKKNNRLLVAIKGQEEGSPLYKGIYEFDLAAKKMPVKPVIKINLQDSAFKKIAVKKLQTVVQPSEIAIHPVNGEIYITDGVRSQLIILDKEGKIKTLYALDKSEFFQPEGIMFTPSGELYIASEGNKQRPSALVAVQIR